MRDHVRTIDLEVLGKDPGNFRLILFGSWTSDETGGSIVGLRSYTGPMQTHGTTLSRPSHAGRYNALPPTMVACS